MTYELNNLSQQEIAVLCQALGELPLKLTINLFSKIQQQVATQDEANAVPVEEVLE